MYDSIVIGGGPAGSTAACEISKRGGKVLLLEKEESPGKKACGGAVSPKFVKDKRLIREYVKRFIFHFPEGEIAMGRDNPIVVTVKRTEFDKSLLNYAKKAGAEILLGKRGVEVKEESERVIVKTEDTTFESRFVILADGFPSIGRASGIGASISDFYIGYVYYLTNGENLQDLHFYIFKENPSGYIWVFPEREEMNAGIICLKSKFSQRVEENLKMFIKNNISGKIIGRKVGVIPVFPAKRLATRRVISIGDAAGFVNPITGGGLDHAINSGVIAGKICASAIKSHSDSLSPFKLRYSPDYLWLTLLSRLMHNNLTYITLFKSYIRFLKCYTDFIQS